MRGNRQGQNLKDFAPETVANLKPVLARSPILTIKCSRLDIFAPQKRNQRAKRVFSTPMARLSVRCATGITSCCRYERLRRIAAL